MQVNYDKLWKLMIDKKINKTQLSEKAGITTNAMAKLGRNESVQVEILAKICNILDCNIEDIMELKSTCGEEIPMKVILETGDLLNCSNIKKASILSMYAGADYIKTSTGKEKISATPEAVYVMCTAIKEYFEETGNKIGLKPAGGLNTVQDALIYYTIVKEVLGKEWLTNKMFRLGTSRLANLLLSAVQGKEVKYF